MLMIYNTGYAFFSLRESEEKKEYQRLSVFSLYFLNELIRKDMLFSRRMESFASTTL